MTIIYEQENQRSAAYDGTALIGQCNYTLNAGTWSIEHTEVDKAYGGQGIAKQLIYCLIDAARKNNVKILPICSYAVKLFEKDPSLEDVLLH